MKEQVIVDNKSLKINELMSFGEIQARLNIFLLTRQLLTQRNTTD